MKTIKMFEATSFGIEVMRMAIEIQLGKQIRLGEYDTYCEGSPRSYSENGRNWEHKNQSIRGALVSVDGLDAYSFCATVELNSFTGAWRSDRIFFELTKKDSKFVRFVAHSKYHTGYHKDSSASQGVKVEYPDFVNSTAEGVPLADKGKWRVGRSFSDAKQFSGIEWRSIMNTYVHP